MIKTKNGVKQQMMKTKNGEVIKKGEDVKGMKRPYPATNGFVHSSAVPTLLLQPQFTNVLPEPPVPKLLRTMPKVEMLTRYEPSPFEREARPLITLEKPLLHRLELVHAKAYGEDHAGKAPLTTTDALLLKDDDLPQEIREAGIKRRKLNERTEASHRQAFGLQLPQLITNDVFTERQRFTTGLAAAEKKLKRDPPGFASMEDLVGRIERTFEQAKETPVHPSKPQMKAKRVMSIVPDAKLWANKYRQVMFDELPRQPRVDDLLFRSQPTPRITTFGLFGPDGESQNSYKLEESYIFDNKGAFQSQEACGEGEAVLLSVPAAGQDGEARFVVVPTVMKLKKQRAARLDLKPDIYALNVTTRPDTEEEMANDSRRTHSVYRDEVPDEKTEIGIVFKNGDWDIENEAGSTRPRTGSRASSLHSES
eukprot:CAMPEP_0206531612 /NCGR_PEP_ID=MMETSP0325_2-20121206/3863_1 /ASSEMBLY_ACC=CAM_ASM_000347 /TAXON_ID=2866 /ORGANISM="Crypthecodinium cohnii, Strain Seligo" /LENGTH=422 /DNA_ID=CAMNT_0054027877 /DNA_START=209 /DNA_END=1474 /DNA_ORIENTATION=+